MSPRIDRPEGNGSEQLARLTAEELLFEAFCEYARLIQTSDLIADLIAAAETVLEPHADDGRDHRAALGACRARAWRRFIGPGEPDAKARALA